MLQNLYPRYGVVIKKHVENSSQLIKAFLQQTFMTLLSLNLYTICNSRADKFTKFFKTIPQKNKDFIAEAPLIMVHLCNEIRVIVQDG